MTDYDYREQAIKDVAEALGETVEALQLMLSNPAEDDFSPEEYQYRYAVAQREARLRLEEALQGVASRFLEDGTPCFCTNNSDELEARKKRIHYGYCEQGRSALEAGKKK